MSCQRSTAIARLNRQTINDAQGILDQILDQIDLGGMSANLLSSVNQILTDYENNLSIIDNEFPDESIAGAPDASATALSRSDEALAGLNDIEERHEILAEDVGGLRDDVESLAGEVEVLGDNLQDLAGDVNELDNNAEVLRDDVDALAEDFGGVRKEVNVLADDVESLAVNVNQQGEENEQRIAALEMVVQQLQAENGTSGDQETVGDGDGAEEDEQEVAAAEETMGEQEEEEEEEEETTDELEQEDDDHSQTDTGSDDNTLGGDNLNDNSGQVETEGTRTVSEIPVCLFITIFRYILSPKLYFSSLATSIECRSDAVQGYQGQVRRSCGHH